VLARDLYVCDWHGAGVHASAAAGVLISDLLLLPAIRGLEKRAPDEQSLTTMAGQFWW